MIFGDRKGAREASPDRSSRVSSAPRRLMIPLSEGQPGWRSCQGRIERWGWPSVRRPAP